MDKQKNSIRKRIQDFFVRIFRAQAEEKSREPEKSPPDSFDLSGMLEKEISPLNDPIWRLLLLILGGSFLTWFFSLLFGLNSSLSIWFISIVALATFLTAVRMLLLVAKLKKFWRVFLAIGFAFLLLAVSQVQTV